MEKMKSINSCGDMNISKIEESYDFVKSLHLYELCDKKTRDSIREHLQRRLPEYLIICDEENNTPEMIASGYVFAKVVEHTQPQDNYVDLIF